MNGVTLLEESQIFGENRLDMFEKYGTSAAITDFAILLGGYVSDYHTKEGNDLKDRTGWYFTKTDDGDNDARAVDYYGIRCCYNVYERNLGARPALPYSSILTISSNEVRGKLGDIEVECGEYPQTIVNKNLSSELERLYNTGLLKETGKEYSTDSVNWDEYDKPFEERKHIEYEYNGEKYIRILGDYNSKGKILSDGRKVEEGKPYFVKVEPIVWMIDKERDIAVSKKLLFSGVQFNNKRNYKGDFKSTDLYYFLETYFSKEIVTDYVYDKQKINDENNLRVQNPYSFDFSLVSEEEIIKGAIESGVPVFLHGKSADGKSARVKQFDPDCEIIYLSNSTPDSLNGKSVYVPPTDTMQEGYMMDIAPTWYMKLVKKCEEEPNKIHIVFFDELTNALPSIQSMAFNIILNNEINGKWKLPINARIVAAGNEMKDSIAANQMAEPLFNRFAHVYIETTVDSWLKWASTPEREYERIDYEENNFKAKIHPSIYAYVAYKSFNNINVLRTEYNGVKPNADPRKWEMASKILYKTGKPEMLRSLIGKDLTNDFVSFTKQKAITVEDVINGNYTDSDLNLNTAQKFATAVGLSSVDEENFEKVRDFMKKIGPEPRAAFESMWIFGNKKRLEKLAELEIAEQMTGGIRK